MENLELFYTKEDFEIPSLSNVTEDDSLENSYFSLEIVEKEYDRKSISKNQDFPGDGRQENDYDLFKGRRIVIYGRPGVGKTTLCKKIAYDFCKNNSNALTEKYDQMIWIELGRLNTFPKRKLESLLEDDYTGFVKMYFDEKSPSFRSKFSNTTFSINFNKALILFDGFDEIQHLIDNCKQLQYLLENIFLTKNVILTSRPYAKLTNVLDCVDQELEIVGFTRETVQQVLERGIGKSYKEERIVEDINKNSVLSEMMKTPILLKIFFFVREDIEEHNITMTKLYIALVKKLFNNFSLSSPTKECDKNRENVIENQVLEEYKHLCDLSIESVENVNFCITLEHLGENIKKKVLLTGFLREVINIDSTRQEKQFNFVHRTVAEYFAASWIANQSEAELKTFVISRKYKPNYQLVLSFISGLMENGLYELNEFPDVTNRTAKKKKLLNFLIYLEMGPVDLCRNYQNVLVTNCLKESTIARTDGQIKGAFEYSSIFRTKIDSKKLRQGSKRLQNDIYGIGNCIGHESMKALFFRKDNLAELCISDNIWQDENPEKLYPELLKELESTIFKLWTENIVAIELVSKSREFFRHFSFETFILKIKDSFDILRDAYVSKPFLTEVQKSTFLARELLSHKTSGKINILTEILGRHQQSRHPNILDTICNNLDKDVLAVYYYDILEIFCQLKPRTSAAILVGYINSKNLRRLLPFLFKNGRILESAIFIENSRLNYLGISSHPLTEKDVLFVQSFPELSKQDHHCHQAVIRTLTDGGFLEEYESFFVKHDLVSLQKLGDQEFENRKLAKNTKYFKEFVGFHKYLSFLYSEGFLSYNDEDNLHLAHLYGSYYFSPANNFTFGPFHIEVSNSNINDDDMNIVVKFIVENRQQIHTLILSNNKIGKPGFQRLMTEVPNSQLKHLLLDRNVIQFDQVRFEMVNQVVRSPNLKTLDLSGNFISKDWIDKLRVNGRNSPAEIDIKFCMLNQCKVIYKRNFSTGFIPALDLFYKTSQKEKITEETGCFGYAMKKNVFDENGNQVLLITEIMADGQRNLKLSEFFQSKENTQFLVFSEYVDPCNDCNIKGIIRKSLFNRLKEYDTPVYGYFSTAKILKILGNIQESKSKVDIGEYLVDERKTQSSYSNCVQWANTVMNTESKFKIVEEKYPALTFLKQMLWRWIQT